MYVFSHVKILCSLFELFTYFLEIGIVMLDDIEIRMYMHIYQVLVIKSQYSGVGSF